MDLREFYDCHNRKTLINFDNVVKMTLVQQTALNGQPTRYTCIHYVDGSEDLFPPQVIEECSGQIDD
jgi:hypothetical protein